MKTLITEDQIRESIGRMADGIQKHYQKKPLTLVGVMIGSIVLLTDLIRQLKLPLRVELIQARNHRNGNRPGPLVIDTDLLSTNIRGRHVLLVDDIFHTGRTLWDLIPQMDDLEAESVRSAVLLRRQGQAEVDYKPDFVAFDVPDGFLVGYGLDYHDQYRNLPYIAALEPEEMQEGKN
jgi:hypoxanthine phosphoribosyltransferase